LFYGLVAAGIILAAAVVRTALVREIGAPEVVCDEFIYSGLARGVSEGHGFTYRGVGLSFSYVYPLLIAPAWLAGAMDTTYEAVKTINVAVMTLVGVPMYLWCRRLASPPWALLGTVLVLLVPAFAFNGLAMTENAAFPTFVTGLFAIALALERPRPAFQALAIVVAIFAWATRFQSVVLVPIYFLAAALMLILEWRAGVGRGELRRRVLLHARPLVVLAVLGAAYLFYKRVTTGYFVTALGPYADLQSQHYPLGMTMRWSVLHLAELVLASGVAPAAALVLLVVLAARGRSRTQAERALVAVGIAGLVLVALQVGAFATSTAHLVVERYSFYAGPILLVALIAWLGRGAPRPLAPTAIAALVPLGLMAYMLREYRETIFGGSLPVNTLTLYGFIRLPLRFGGDRTEVLLLTGAGAAVAVLAFVFLPRVALLLLPLGVAVTLVGFSRPVWYGTMDLSQYSLRLAGNDTRWVDERVGGDADVAMFVTPHPDPFQASSVLLQTEFWNRAVKDVYRLGASEACPLPARDAVVDPASGRIEQVSAGAPAQRVTAPYVVVQRGTAVFGRRLADGGSALNIPLELFRVIPPLRIQSASEGAYADGWMSGYANFSQYAARGGGGTVLLTLSRRAWLGPDKPGRVTVRYGPPVHDETGVHLVRPRILRWTIHSGTERTFRIRARSLPIRVEVTIKPTFSPADYGAVDTRQLGAQVAYSFAPG
jgi:hypothetical protein